MKSFTLHQPTRLFFGQDQLTPFVKSAAALGRHALLVTGGSSARRLGYEDRLASAFRSAGVAVTTFPGIEPNPQAGTIDRAAVAARDAGCDCVIALGGGSVMDAAKGIAALLRTGEPHIWPFCWGESRAGTLTDAAPVIAVPTTAATASEVTPYAVISHSPVRGKSGLAHDFLKPAVAWLNPEFTASVPAVTTADGAADIISHALEAYLTGGPDSPLADRHAESVIATVLETLGPCLAAPSDLHLRGVLLWASNLALNGYETAGRIGQFPLHAMEHALSGWRPELAHGRGLATLFPAWFRWLFRHGRALDRMARLGRTLFGITEPDSATAASGFIAAFIEWLRRHDLHQSLTTLGFERADFPAIADYAVRVYGADGVIEAAGPLSAADIVAIFEDTTVA